MNTALIPIADMERMALAFAKSGLFGTKTTEQCMALLLLAQAEGAHPAIAMRDFDVIQGRPAKKAEAIQRAFLAAGGKIEWHRYEDTGAAATFSHPQGGTLRVDWDEARAKKAGLSQKDMYGKYSRQMYGARVLSEGCRRVYPASTSGMYVPEEVRAFQKREKDMGPAEVIDDGSPAHLPKDKLEQDFDNEQNRVAGSEQPPTPDAIPAQGIPSAASGPPRTRTDTLKELCAKAAVTLPDVLAKAGVKHAYELSDKDWQDATAMLKRRIEKREAA